MSEKISHEQSKAIPKKRKPKAVKGASCAYPVLGRVTKPALWAATALISAALAFPYVAPRILGV